MPATSTPALNDWDTRQERYRLALEANALGAWDYNPATNELLWDDRCRELFSVSNDTPVTVELFLGAIHPDDIELTKAAISKSLTTPEDSRYKMYYRTIGYNDGRPRCLYATGKSYFNEDGQAIRFIGTVQDVTEEKQMAAERVAGEHFRATVVQSPLGICVLSGEQFIIASANRKMLELWGKNDYVIGLPLLHAMPELEGQAFEQTLRQVRNTGESVSSSNTLVKMVRNGVAYDHYFDFMYAPMLGPDGTASSVMITVTDLTAQVNVRKKLEESEERFRSLVAAAPIAIAVYTGREMTITVANEAVLKIWDRDASVIGRTFRDVLPELEGQPFFQLLDDVYRTGITYEATEDKVDLFVGGRLQTFYFNFTYKALRNADGAIYGVINTATDVTTFVNARNQLLETKERLDIALGTADLGTWSINLLTGQVFFSDRAKALYGFPGDEIDMQAGFNAIHEKDRERAVKHMQQSIQPGASGNYTDEYTVRNLQDGVERVVKLGGKVFFNEAGIACLLTGAVQDITAQKKIELELERQVQLRTGEIAAANYNLKEANTDLARVNENLEQFAYVASHDLQEPLRKIRMFTSLLAERSAKILDAPSQLYLAKVTESADRMTRLITDILNFSKVTALETLFEQTDLNLVLQSVLKDLELLITQKNGQVNCDMAMPVLAAVPVQMNQLFYNLVGNALKFTRKEVPPVIDIRSVLLTSGEVAGYSHLHPDNEYYKITVRDNGIGFDQQFARQIFTIFQRLHSRDKYDGTGIGLALCQTIVKQHHGTIFAESLPGVGTAFHIILPVKQAVF